MARDHLPNLSGEEPFRLERTGHRDLAMSGALGYVADAKHLDMDGYQYCPACYMIECCMEAVGGSSDKPTDMTTAIAKQLGVPMLLIRHAKGDTDHSQPISVLCRYNGTSARKPWHTWGELVRALEELHEKHVLSAGHRHVVCLGCGGMFTDGTSVHLRRCKHCR